LLGVGGDLFEGVDATEPDVEVVITELRDGLGVPVGEMTSLAKPEGSFLTLFSESKALLGQPKALGGKPLRPAVQPEGT
jgi:hypothetical protein